LSHHVKSGNYESFTEKIYENGNASNVTITNSLLIISVIEIFIRI
jgi:hypothetical protein